METPGLADGDEIRARFSRRMSDMYRREVPQYGALLDLVADVNAAALRREPALRERLARAGELERLGVERHGAIRLGSARELATMRRVFAVMGMRPVGYYDLSVAGVPVHATAFRPVEDASLARNPFRVFTSLLRLDLIEDAGLRMIATDILERRRIFTPVCWTWSNAPKGRSPCRRRGRRAGGRGPADVSLAQRGNRGQGDLRPAARCPSPGGRCRVFQGPHINHLTPRTLDIDAVQAAMPVRGIAAKTVIEGPPARKVALLLRQTSFKALEERIAFVGEDARAPGTHTARFGEIEQRGVALTRKGRARYDTLLANVRHGSPGSPDRDYAGRLAGAFKDFPDDLTTLRREGLAFFRYARTSRGSRDAAAAGLSLEAQIERGLVRADPIVYEDFLPVSAAGIFQSNLGGAGPRSYAGNAAQAAFEHALGAPVLDEIALYEAAQARSLEALHAKVSQ